MKQKKQLLIISLLFVALLAGASVLYSRLGSTLAPDQLAVQQPHPTESAEKVDATESTESTTPPPTAPNFTVYDLEGNPVQLSDFLGKPVVLNFWASWCGPCQMEMPDFQEKYLELGDEIHFLMVNMTDGSRETVSIASEFISAQGYTFPVYYDTESSAAYAYSVYSLPTTYFIDAEGHAIAQATGAISGETLQRGIDMIT